MSSRLEPGNRSDHAKTGVGARALMHKSSSRASSCTDLGAITLSAPTFPPSLSPEPAPQIVYYAKRNELMHTNFVPLIRAGKFKDISTILHNDLRLVLPPGDLAESDLM